MRITIYGSGCARCKQTEALIRRTAAELGVPAEIEKIADPRAIATAGILTTPAVAVDDIKKVAGRVPSREEVAGWLTS